MNYIRKADFYDKISNLRRKLGFDNNTYRVDFVALCKQMGMEIGEMPFFTSGLRGMASLGSGEKKDVIILNTARNKFEQNVDCAHEFVHINFHRSEGYQSFKCFDKAQPNQNKYLEWQANEGSAELVVPYRSLLPKVKEAYPYLNSHESIYSFKEELVQVYGVTSAVISYRLESLKYEIQQFVNGVPMQNLQVLSHNSQIKQGINIKSLNDIANEDLSKRFEELYSFSETQWAACKIIQEWADILLDIGGLIRASFYNTDIESTGDNCFKIIFYDYSNYLIGSRGHMINELKGHILKTYGIQANLDIEYKNRNCIYVSNEELRSNISIDLVIS